MNLLEYTELSSRTANGQKGNEELMHYALGTINELAGEISPYVANTLNLGLTHTLKDKDKLIAEFGDIMWYIVQLSSALDIPLHLQDSFLEVNWYQHEYLSRQELGKAYRADDDEISDLYLLSLSMVGELTEHIKKVCCFRHPRDNKKESRLLRAAFTCVLELMILFEVSVTQVMVQNIEKLKKRYPEGFSVEDSIKRKDILEN